MTMEQVHFTETQAAALTKIPPREKEPKDLMPPPPPVSPLSARRRTEESAKVQKEPERESEPQILMPPPPPVSSPARAPPKVMTPPRARPHRPALPSHELRETFDDFQIIEYASQKEKGKKKEKDAESKTKSKPAGEVGDGRASRKRERDRDDDENSQVSKQAKGEQTPSYSSSASQRARLPTSEEKKCEVVGAGWVVRGRHAEEGRRRDPRERLTLREEAEEGDAEDGEVDSTPVRAPSEERPLLALRPATLRNPR